MFGKLQLTCSEGNVPLSTESQSSELFTSTAPCYLQYHDGTNYDILNTPLNDGHQGNETRTGSQESMDCGQDLSCSTPVMVQVPFRRLPFSPSSPLCSSDKENYGTSSPKELHKYSAFGISPKSIKISKIPASDLLQPTRKPLRTISEKYDTPPSAAPQSTDSDDEMVTPVVSRSSSLTSVASSVSSISPIAPLKRHQYRIQEKDIEKKPPCKVDLKTEYQQLLTKYFKAKKLIRQLKDQSKHDQKRISLLEFSRQQDATLADKEVPEIEHVSFAGSEEVNQVNTFNTADAGEDDNISQSLRTFQDDAKENIPFRTEDIVDLENGLAVMDNPTLEVKEELVTRMAAVISDQTLRPIIFSVPLDSPPSKMPSIIEKLSKSGNCCANCGRMIGIKGKQANT